MSEEKLDAFVRRNLQPPHISRTRQESVLGRAAERLGPIDSIGPARRRQGVVRRFALPLGSALVLGLVTGLFVPAAPQTDTLSALLLNSRTTIIGF